MRKTTFLTAVILILCLCMPAAAEKTLTLTFTGDVTLWSEEVTRNTPASLSTS